MKIYNIKKRGNKYNIELSNNIVLSLYTDTIIEFNLLKPREISGLELKKINDYNNFIECYNKALRFINIRYRTKKELYDKLDYPKNIVDKVIEKLEDNGYINNNKYIESFINDSIKYSNKGPILIKQELLSKGIDKELIDIYLNKIDSNIWINKGINLANKKVNSNKLLSSKLLSVNISNYLMSKGYMRDTINIVIDSIDLVDNLNIIDNAYKGLYNRLKRKYNGEELDNKIKYNLYKKGFSLSEIDKYLNKD